uniref:Far upstream element-binding protein C-terminal domain-containing protein n=1 Tax=Acrobeloides nanus TaxID=290746 RepID=A0A914DAW5_9BILA
MLDLYQSQTQQIQKASSHMGKAQPDYSTQWVKFYRDIGMYEQANLLEQKIKDHETKFEENHQLLGQNATL